MIIRRATVVEWQSAAKDDQRNRTPASPAPPAPPARPDPKWVWVNVVAMVVALALVVVALVRRDRATTDLHVRLCAISAFVLAHVAFVWLCCLLAPARATTRRGG